MEPAIIGVTIPIIAIIGAIIMIIYLRKYQNMERMAMIEKGVDATILFTKKQRPTFITLRFSLLLMGIGIGFLLGYFLDSTFNMEEIGYFSMLFIFGGVGLGLAYLVEEKKINEERAGERRSE